MRCTNCGKKIYSSDKFCPYCGDRQNYSRRSTPGGKKPLQEKFLRGEYQETTSEPEYYDEEEYYEYEYDDQEEYEDQKPEYKEKKSSGWSLIFLLLILALVIGFVVGILYFTSRQATPSLPI